MTNNVQQIDDDIDSPRLAKEVLDLYEKNNFGQAQQISLTSVSGNDDWFCSVGRIKECKYPEEFYSTINKSLIGTYIHECISRYSDYYRWRILLLLSNNTYSIHTDALFPNKQNFRLHIPVVTNHESFLCFYDKFPVSGETANVHYAHLRCGNSYKVNTTGLHTAVNHGKTHRVHLVGVKYENRDNRTQ